MMSNFAIRMGGSVAAGAVIIAAAFYVAPQAPNANASSVSLTAHTATVAKRTLREALSMASLSPAALAASGLSTQQTADLIDRARSHMNEGSTNYEQVFSTHRAATLQVRTLQQKVQAGTGTAEDTSALASAQSALTSATSAREAAVATFMDATLDGLSESALASLTQLRANRSIDLPMQYLIVDRSEGDWLKLRDSLAIEREAAAKGESVDSATSEFLTGVNTDPAVIAAKTGLTHLAEVEAAWNAAINEQ
ncbi:MAG: hypothetical protein U0638_12400 [Phycisphaerales bacterium]